VREMAGLLPSGDVGGSKRRCCCYVVWPKGMVLGCRGLGAEKQVGHCTSYAVACSSVGLVGQLFKLQP
jgi:hypothetical protein